jgi:phosphocarrier protein
MQKVIVMVKNEEGLHARPAKTFVNEAKKFEADVRIQYNEKEINAKSILQLLSLGIGKGKELAILADGKDEEKAVQDLKNLIENDLDA